MKSLIAFFLVLILIAGGFGIYFYFEKPAQDEVLEFVNFNIFAKDINDELVKTNYKIYVDGNFYEDGETSNRAGILHEVPRNKTIMIYNYGDSYYSNKTEIFTAEDKPYRINFKLEKAGNITLNHSGVFGQDKQLNVSLKSSEVNRNLKMCIKWSSHIIYIKTDLEQLDEREKGFDKCYHMNDITYEGSFILDYEIFGTIDEKDYIGIKFIGFNVEPFGEEKKNYEEEFSISI